MTDPVAAYPIRIRTSKPKDVVHDTHDTVRSKNMNHSNVILRESFVLLFALLLLCATPLTVSGRADQASQQAESPRSHLVRGVVLAEGSGAPISGASVRLEPLNLGTSTDADGRFVFTDVPAGVQTVSVFALGYRTGTTRITAGGGEIQEVEIRLASDPLGIDGLTVAAARSRVATKAETEILATPQAISVVSEAVIEQQAATTLDDVARNVSGLIRASSVNGEYSTFAGRGFYLNSNGNFRRNGVQISKFGELLDANTDRVEVLKGPATVLYGQLDPGAVINIRTKQPLRSAGMEAQLAGGSFGRIDGRIDATGPISDQLLYRLNARVENRDSFRDEVFWETRFVSPVLTWLPSPRTSVTLEAEIKREEGLLDEGLFGQEPTLESLDAQPIGRFLGEPDVIADRGRTAVLGTLEQTLGDGRWSARLVTSWANDERNANRVDLRTLESDGRTLNRRTDFRQQDLETLFWDAGMSGSFSLGPSSHRVAFGVDGYGTDRSQEILRGSVDPIDITDPVYTGADAPSPFSAEDQSVDMVGVYAQDQITFGDAWVVQLGLRYTTFDQQTVDPTTGSVDSEFSAEEFTPSAGIVYRVDPDLSVYGSMSEAFAPTLSTDRDGNPFDPNFGRQYELGMKADLLDRRLSTTVAVYHLRREGMISFVFPPEGGFYRVQGGVQRSRGFEVDLVGRLAGNLSAIGSYGFTDGEVLEDETYEPGRLLGGAPRHHGSLWVRGAFAGGFSAGAGVFFQSDWKAFTSYEDTQMLQGYRLLDAMVGYSFENGILLQVNGRNLTDTRYYVSGGVGRAGGLPAQPRAFDISVTWTSGALDRR